MSHYLIRYKPHPQKPEPQKPNLTALGGYETLKTKTLASAIQKAGALSKQSPKIRYEIYYQGDKQLSPSLMMVIQGGATVAAKSERKRC